MTIKTKAEIVFEEFCNSNSIGWEKIKEGESRAPDYEIYLGGELVFVEIKQIDKDENFGIESCSRTVGSHIRRRIQSARKQVQAGSNEGAPSVLLVYNNLDPWQMFGTEQHDFIDAMYGERTVVLDTDTNAITDSFQGGNRSLEENKNTSFSAVGLLYKKEDCAGVHIYENVFAKNPLEFSKVPNCIEVTRIEIE
ncbi:MAG: hypothetical protein RDU59_10735 [Thermodesulfobacteriota bacterium]|nr:hypothetical protein [Thermodesulfobacteriota bacterium]